MLCRLLTFSKLRVDLQINASSIPRTFVNFSIWKVITLSLSAILVSFLIQRDHDKSYREILTDRNWIHVQEIRLHVGLNEGNMLYVISIFRFLDKQDAKCIF